MSSLFIRFSSTYFWYFSVIGLVVPFLSVYLDGKRFNSLQIGEIIAIFTATKIVGPTFWATFADKTGKQLLLIRLGSFFTVLSFCLLFVIDGYWPISFSLALFGLFWTSILPQLEAMTTASIRGSDKIYARIRLWGSVGFIVAAVIGGEAMSAYHPDAFLWLGLVILTGLFVSSLSLKQPIIRQHKQVDVSSIFDKIYTQRFICFLLPGYYYKLALDPFIAFMRYILET